MCLCYWFLALASSIPVLGLEKVCPRKGCPWPWIFFVSLVSNLVSSTPPLLRNLPDIHNSCYNFVEYIIRTISHHLNMNLTPQDVDIAHPLRKATNGKTLVIIKFVKRSHRNAIYQKKRLLASCGLSLTESLTKKKLNLLQARRQRGGISPRFISCPPTVFFRSEHRPHS